MPKIKEYLIWNQRAVSPHSAWEELIQSVLSWESKTVVPLASTAYYLKVTPAKICIPNLWILLLCDMYDFSDFFSIPRSILKRAKIRAVSLIFALSCLTISSFFTWMVHSQNLQLEPLVQLLTDFKVTAARALHLSSALEKVWRECHCVHQTLMYEYCASYCCASYGTGLDHCYIPYISWYNIQWRELIQCSPTCFQPAPRY